jgi:hypothetical protein
MGRLDDNHRGNIRFVDGSRTKDSTVPKLSPTAPSRGFTVWLLEAEARCLCHGKPDDSGRESYGENQTARVSLTAHFLSPERLHEHREAGLTGRNGVVKRQKRNPPRVWPRSRAPPTGSGNRYESTTRNIPELGISTVRLEAQICRRIDPVVNRTVRRLAILLHTSTHSFAKTGLRPSKV